jgi:carboxyl-terminal processing protease
MKKIFSATLLSTMLFLGSTVLAQPTYNRSETTDKFATLLQYIESIYVDSVNSKQLVEKAIIHMLEELDPHSTYISAEEVAEANEPLQGSFDGIGIQFNILHDTIFVVEPIQGGPSEKLGIRAGDKIVEVDGVNMAGIGVKNSDVLAKLRGPKGTKVKVGMARKGFDKLLYFDITRDKIPIYSIDAAYMIAPEIGYIKVSRFAATTTEELKKGIAELKEQGMRDLILDLQDNGGGLLRSAIEMGDEFLSDELPKDAPKSEKGKLLVYTEGRAFKREPFNTRSGLPGSFEKGRLVVLIDESSASASEIVSGAIQDWDRGVIVGRRSFGKGLVQRPVNLPDGSVVRLTVQKYYTPAGRCIQKPYDEGKDDYYDDYAKRLKSGEFFSADSIKFPDSLKYETRITKRTVYGGGGIMPDIFVPLDTSENSRYFSDIIRVGVQNDWSMSYANDNRQELLKTYPTMEIFAKNFILPKIEEDKIIQMAVDKEVPFDAKGYENSRHAIGIRTKALLARNLYDNEAFYYLINDLNPSAKKAVEILNSGAYDQIGLDPKVQEKKKVQSKK